MFDVMCVLGSSCRYQIIIAPIMYFLWATMRMCILGS